MPDLITSTNRRFLTFGGLLALGVVCPPTLGVVGAMAASVAGGVVANDLVPLHLNQLSVKLRRSEAKLANHDITNAAGLAVGLLIQSVAESGKYGKESENIKQLAHKAAKEWPNLIAANRDGEFDNLDELREEELTQLFGKTGNEFYEQEVLDLEDWQIILQDGLCEPYNLQLSDNIIFDLAETLQQGFAKALREVLKADFEEGGKAFGSMLLSMLGEILAILKDLPATADNTAIQNGIEAIEARQQQLQQNIEAGFKALAQQINSGFDGVIAAIGASETRLQNWLQDELHSLHQKLDELRDEVKTGFEETSRENQEILEDTRKIREYLEQNQPVVQEVSFFLDTNPPAVTDWQGRENDLAIVNRWLDDENTKLGVIVGIGGMGKSTLAAKIHNERIDFEKKLWLDLSQRPSYSIVARGILQHLGNLSAQEAEQIEETRLTRVVINCLQQKRFLLVLDNLESVLHDEAYRDFLQQWVGECHRTEILVTTQESPQIDQAKPTELPLRGLSNEAGGQFLSVSGIQGDKGALERYSEQVQGHPLTLKLVAGLLNAEKGDAAHIRDVDEIGIADVAALMSRLEGTHRREKVQLVAVLDASFRRLEEKLQGVLRGLVVLRGGFDAAVAVAISGEEVTRRELLQLERRGLIVATDNGCYEFQPFIAEYMRFRVGDLTQFHRRAIEFYQSRYKPREDWETVADVREYLEVFHHRCELGEYEAAFDTIYDGSNIDRDVDNFLSLRGNYQLSVELYQQLIANLPDRQDWRYRASLTSLGNAYHSLGRYQDAIAFHEQSLEIAREIGDRRGEAASLGNLGLAYDSLGRYQDAIAYHEQSLAIQREIGDRQGEAASLGNLGNAYNSLGRYEDAIAYYEQQLAIARDIGDRRGEATSLGNLGSAYYSLGRYPDAIAYQEQSLAIQREIGNRGGEAASLGSLGNAYYSLGRYEDAIAFHEQSLAIAREIGDRQGEANSLGNLGNAYNSLGRYPDAIAFHEQSLEIMQQIEDRLGEAMCLNNLGEINYSLEKYQTAIQFYQQAIALKQNIGNLQSLATSWENLGTVLSKLNRIDDALGAYRNARQFYQDIQLSHKVEECNTAIQQLETPPPAPRQTFWQKIHRFYRHLVQFLRNLIS